MSVNAHSSVPNPSIVQPLVHPFGQLAEALNQLVVDGQIQSIEQDLTHPDCPCFLLNVFADKPRFYVELFSSDLDEPVEDGDEAMLCVLMNWMGSSAEPAHWETEFVEEPNFEEVLSQILSVILDITQPRAIVLT